MSERGFNAIAVAIDGSRLSEAALHLAIKLARQLDTRLSLITVMDRQVEDRFEEYCRTERVPLDEAVRRYQHQWIDTLREQDLPSAGHVVEPRHNSTSQTIMEVADHVAAALLVVGTHGRGGIKRVLGSTTQALVDSGTIPVLVARPQRSEDFAEL